MGGEIFKSCRSWFEDIYWTRFQFIHFVQFLSSGFDQHLALPKKLSDNLKKKLPENVALRGPGGALWNIGLTTRDDTLYFEHGWQQFVKDHSLEENDFLVFKYNGESRFDVLIFDRETFCEKVAAIFVPKCGHTADGSVCLINRKDTDNSFEVVNAPSNADVEFASPEKSTHGNNVTAPALVPSQITIEETFNAGVKCASPEQFMDVDAVTVAAAAPSQTTSKRIRIRKLVSVVKQVSTKQVGRPKPSNARRGVVNRVPDDAPASVGRTKKGTYEASYTSNRRPVTEKEIKNALQLSKAACTNDSFTVVMRPTHVYKRFYVSIPGKWMKAHLSPRTQDVILRNGKSEWHVRYFFNYARNTGGLTGRWKHFAVDNNLEEFDVCVFTPTGKINNVLVVNVSIFRVIEEVTPLSKVNSAGKRVGGNRKYCDI